jgi:hypothetical protein
VPITWVNSTHVELDHPYTGTFTPDSTSLRLCLPSGMNIDIIQQRLVPLRRLNSRPLKFASLNINPVSHSPSDEIHDAIPMNPIAIPNDVEYLGANFELKR